jgi:hypothetical protein
MGLERGPLSLVSIIEELFERKSGGCGLETWDYSHRDPSCWPRGTLYPRKLALTSPTSGDRSVGIVSSRTKATEFSFFNGNENHESRTVFFLFSLWGHYDCRMVPWNNSPCDEILDKLLPHNHIDMCGWFFFLAPFTPDTIC